ncbi:MAG: SAM-dependent methyltransferase [Frankia sp.]
MMDAQDSAGWPWRTLTDDSAPAVDLKMDQPHSARIYDYLLGGKDNFPADREGAEQVIRAFPTTVSAARQNRAFMLRATRYLAGEMGIRQFLDIGTGIPTSPNLHEVAQSIAPRTRVVYADNDPIVLIHARALMASSPEGRTAYLDADLRDPDRILDAPELRDTLDFTQPVALSLVAILHFIEGDAPYAIVRRLVDALPTGSYLVLSHTTTDVNPRAQDAADSYRARGIPFQHRGRGEIERLFDGLTLIEPGLQIIHRWRADGTAGDLSDAEVSLYGGVARK